MRVRYMLGCLLPRPDLRKRLREARLCDLGIEVRLQAQPPAVGKPEEAAQPQIGVGGNSALAGDTLADALRRLALHGKQRVPAANQRETSASWERYGCDRIGARSGKIWGACFKNAL
jgi:hypothetical protein